ncbi:MAG: ATP-binding protein [Candidatus Sumerlaeia bacterium]|nr:ATP-binding protein [Candidatus Sumerlaeia bacterium]
MATLKLNSVGPIHKANIDFGDLTLFVGPQASGKSIALQWLKLALDRGLIQRSLTEYGLDWNRNPDTFMEIYFGEGLHSLWGKGSSAIWEKTDISPEKIAQRRGTGEKQSVFLVPAQRVLALRDGWARPFSDYSAGDPYVVRAFSESLRRVMEDEFSVGENIFPRTNSLKKVYRDLLGDALFSGFSLSVERTRAQKRLMLKDQSTGTQLPFMVWSAGQREFMPLLIGLLWLLPPSRVPRRNDIKWVVIEEPEMGLHPRAISVALVLILELMQRGYKVCLSTHSTQTLEFAWVLSTLRQSGGSPDQLLEALGAPRLPGLRAVAGDALKANVRAYYFENGREVVDISSLDPDAADSIQASWGGLVEPSERANDVVAQVMANSIKNGSG